MTKPKSKGDEVKLAKVIAEYTKLPLPRVAQVMQKYPLDRDPKALADECLKLAAVEMKKTIYGALNIK